jgi:hypothetical protein
MAFPPSNSAVESKAPRALLSVVLGFLIITATPSPASTRDFHVPQDTALQIRLDDTLTSVDSQIGNPFSATVVDTPNTGMRECTVT